MAQVSTTTRDDFDFAILDDRHGPRRPTIGPANSPPGNRHWVRSIRSGEGAIRYPSPAEAAERPWTDEDEAPVADRTATQLVGTDDQVVSGLQRLVEAWSATAPVAESAHPAPAHPAH